MTKPKQVFRHFWKNKYHIYISVLTLYSVLCWSTFGSYYSFESSWVRHYKLGKPVFGVSPILLCRSSQALSGWIGSTAAQLFSGLSRDVGSSSSPGSGWATQGHSETCPEATPVLSWLLFCWKVLSAQFGWAASSRKSLGGSKLLPFKIDGGPCVLGDLQCCRMFLVPFPRSVPQHNPV